MAVAHNDNNKTTDKEKLSRRFQSLREGFLCDHVLYTHDMSAVPLP